MKSQTASKSSSSKAPSGTVTFLFSDIEGSTQLLHRLGDKYPQALEEQRAIMRAAFQQFQGYEIDTAGDGFFVAFSRAQDGVAAAIAAQRRLAAHHWPEDETLRVRMALHTGEPTATATGYVGIDVHRAARLCSAGHGGQILISETTRQLVAGNLPDGVSWRDLGEHRLKDLQQAEHIYQIIAADLQADFPSLKTLSSRPNNLPAPTTQLIGRENESEALRQLLLNAEARLVTLTGPGGIGKTSLSLQVATSLLDQFEHGIFFLSLAAISDPELVLPTIAQTLGIRENRNKPWRESVIDHLRDKHFLLVLDNFEQVVAAAPVVSDLLAACPHLKILVTSRIVLHLKGEREFPVAPLPAPDPQAAVSKDALSQYAAVALFIQRALAVKPDFEVNNDNAPAVAEICFRLEGLPLAIELAAARLKLLSPQALLARLGSRLELLRGGPRDMPARHQTLRQAIAWSYDLLPTAEQAFFQRLAIFIGGCSLEAVEAICNTTDELALEALDGLTALIDKSLLRQAQMKDGEPRFVMLETIREFAFERLQASADWQATRRRHADFFLALAEKAGPELTGPKQIFWLNTLEREHDNLRAVFSWTEETEQAEFGLRLGAAIWRFWIVRGHMQEGRQRLLALLALPGASQRTRQRAKVLNAAGTIIHELGDFITARQLLEESLEIWRKMGDKKGMATVINNLGWIAAQLGELTTAGELSGESLTLHAELGDKRGMAVAFNNLATLAFVQAEFPRARSLQENNLNLRQEIGDERGVAYATALLGWVEVVQGNYEKAAALLETARAKLRELGDNMIMGFSAWILTQMALDQGDFDRAAKLMEESSALIKDRDPQMLWLLALVKQHDGDQQQAQALLEESLAKFRAWGYKWGIANALYHIGRQALDRHDDARAAACFQESMGLNRDLGNRLGLANVLAGFGDLALAKNNPARSARLFAAAEALHQDIGAPMPPYQKMRFEREVALARAQLGEEAFAAAWSEGMKMTMAEAVKHAST
ncbi:tetratricopeptide repeat protein [candidate division KSB1 bacterium]|nr:tetratricopeptide repeat protein [candidate division KSB1 bacterium]